LCESAADDSEPIGVGRGVRGEKWLRKQLRGSI